MNTSRKIAIIVGVLFIIGTVAGVLSVGFLDPILDDPNYPNYLTTVSANKNQIAIGAIFVLIMGLALAMVPVVIFPIFKKYNETLALGYVVFRGGLETVTYIVMVFSYLLIIILSQEYVQAGAPDASYFQPLGTILLVSGVQIHSITKIVFPLGALMYNYFFYKSKLVPRWLSVWGLIGAILYLPVGVLAMFGSPFDNLA